MSGFLLRGVFLLLLFALTANALTPLVYPKLEASLKRVYDYDAARDAWDPSLFTNPAKHSEKNYRYIVNGITPVNENENNEEKRTNSLGRMNDISIYAKLPLSTSIIDQDHGETWSQLGFILRVPKECVYVSSPLDLGNQISTEYTDDIKIKKIFFLRYQAKLKAKSTRFQLSLNAQFSNAAKKFCRRKAAVDTTSTQTLDECREANANKLFSPDDVLAYSQASQGFHNQQHNEIFVLGTSLNGKPSVQVIAGWAKGCFKNNDWTYPDVPKDYMNKLKTVLGTNKLPFISLPCNGNNCNC